MTGLILKDLLVLRKSLRSFLLVLLVYGAIVFGGVWPPEVAAGLMMTMTAILPMNVFAYDKQCKWDVYGLSLPVSRTKTVAARYLCVLLLCLLSLVLTAVFGAVLYAAGRMEEPMDFLISCSILGLIAVLINAIMLPFLYKFGPERARMMFIAIIGALCLLVLAVIAPLGGLRWINSLEVSEAAMISAIAAAAGAVLLTLSFLLSRKLYAKQDM